MPRARKSKVRTSIYENDEVKAIVEDLVPQFHGTLRDARIFCAVEVREAVDTEKVLEPRAQDWRKWGRVEVANKADLAIEHWHFRIILQGNAWERTSDDDKIGSVDWLLAMCAMQDGRPRKSPGDAPDFYAGVYRRRGPFNKSLQVIEAAVKGKKAPREAGTLDLDPEAGSGGDGAAEAEAPAAAGKSASAKKSSGKQTKGKPVLGMVP